jgi:hypothetical protein
VIRSACRSRWNRSSRSLRVQLPRVGLAQQRSFVSQEVDVERRPCELISRQLLKPVSYFRFQLNRTQAIALML